MVAHNENHVWEPGRASLKELMITVATILFAHGVVGITLSNVVGNADVTTKNQHIGIVCVVKIQVAKFQVYVRY
jgi:hypothetical protein